jgi:ADP-heptose:LPS heptosyltransferase
VPEDADLLKWAGIINAADYFVGCDSVGQHLANALKKPATVVIGSTFPENISYPDNKNFTLIDNGTGKRTYSPIRITHDHGIERDNEDCMILSDETFEKIVKSVQNKLGKPKKDKQISSNVAPHVHSPSCSHSQPGYSVPNFEKKYGNVIESLTNNG